jgi:formamidopyrimidine-DNA glycosylase
MSMPELPEVEVIVRELRREVLAEEIAGIKLYWKKCLVTNGHPWPLYQTIQAVDRNGKFIIFDLEHLYLLIHLRMSGRLIFWKTGNFDRSHLRMCLQFRSGNSLLFYDTRKFGRIYLTADRQQFLGRLGTDALDQRFSEQDFIRLLNNKKGVIKTFLLDQHHLAGLGNIYADESLFRARIHPRRSVDSLSVIEVKQLYRAIRKTLNSALLHMGTTLADYRTPSGGEGRNQKFLKVYDREQKPCFRCKNPIEKERIGGRGTHFCPVCQPLISNSR